MNQSVDKAAKSQGLAPPRVAILASGSGSTAEAFIRATQDGRVEAHVGVVICNNPPGTAKVYERIAQLNEQYKLDIRVFEISGRTHPDGNVGRGQTLAESAAIVEKVRQAKCDHVALMGYMKLVRGELIERYGWSPKHNSIYEARMSNTHPGPLPETEDTYGIHASEKVLALGLSASKHTFHLVAEGMDRGPVIAEHPVAVADSDTAQQLFDRVQVTEKVALPYALDNFLRKQRDYAQHHN